MTIGNRAILEGQRVDGLQVVATRQNNLNVLTVFILPSVALTEEQTILVGAILNQIEMLSMLHRAGCLRPAMSAPAIEKEIHHDIYS